MAKQKFRCEGVLRKTGQRVAVEVLAESKQLALKMADQHGVTVQRIGPAVVAKPLASPAADEALGADDENVDGLLDSVDASDPFDLAGAAAGPAPSGAPAMKACPYCGEPILAVAIKCKHCGAGIPLSARPSERARQPSGEVAEHGNYAIRIVLANMMVVWLLVPVVLLFGGYSPTIVAATVIAFLASAATFLWTTALTAIEAERVKAANGAIGWFLFAFFLWPVAFPMWMYCRSGYGLKNQCTQAAVAVALCVAGQCALALTSASRAWQITLPVAPTTAPSAPTAALHPPPPAPKPEAPKASAEELAFAAKLTAFLDVCDATVKVLEDATPSNTDKKRHEALAAMVTRYSTIGAPPRGVAWAEDAAKDAGGLAEVATLAIAAATTNEAFKELGQAPPDPAATAAGYRDAATRMRDIVAMVRAKIPPACLPKTP